jgi:hypothetical protein
VPPSCLAELIVRQRSDRERDALFRASQETVMAQSLLR